MLPNLLIIGAAKSGTTSLHSYLDEHPEIAMARPKGGTSGAAGNDTAPKEMRFFWRDDWREHLDWYASHFETDAPIRGEATPAYSQHPYHAGVAARIHSVVPDAKLLYIVRDPIERLVAHYLQQRADGDRRSFAERMADLERPDPPLVCASRYAMQVDNYLRLFDPSQLMVIDHQDLRHDRSYTLREIFRFLGVDEDFSSPSFYSERNAREDKRALTRVGAPLF